MNKYGLQDHHFLFTKVFRNTEESLYNSGRGGGGCSSSSRGTDSGTPSTRASIRTGRSSGGTGFSRMCSSYRLSTVLEDPDDQSCGSGRLTFGEQYEIHKHKSPVILKFLQERLRRKAALKSGNSKRLKLEGVPAWHPRRFYSAEGALEGGSLPGLFPSSPVGRVQRSFPAPSLRVRRSPSTPEMPSRKFQEYQCYDGSTFRGRLPPAYSQIINPVSSQTST